MNATSLGAVGRALAIAEIYQGTGHFCTVGLGR